MKTEHIKESILDAPKPGLDENVWTKTKNGYILTELAKARIAKLLKWLVTKYEIPDIKVFIIGSITSNQYSDNSDIDINVCTSVAPDKDTAAELAKKIKKDFAEEYIPNNGEDYKVGTHPFEVYIQYNPYRCLASVGCYDFFNEEWKVGPDLKKQSYDPTSEYYDKGRRQLGTSIKDIRNTILDVYETSLVVKKSDNKKFKTEKFTEILKKLAHAQKVFMKIHNDRGDFDDKIDSEKNALKMRDNKQRNKADATYKFLDKFGYVSILREYSNLKNEADEKKPDMNSYLDRIIKVVKDNLNADKALANEEEFLSESQCLKYLKKISFPAKEWPSLKKQQKIVTTRVSDEYGIYNVGDIVVTPWRDCYRVDSSMKLDHLIDHPHYSELTDDQLDFLIDFDRFDVLTLIRLDIQNESVQSALSMSVIAAMLAIPGLLPAKTLEKELHNIPRSELRFNSLAVNNAMEKSAVEHQQWNGMSFMNMTNLLASVSYNEGMLDWLKTKDDNCLIAVLNSIDNRSGGDPVHYTAEIMRKSQYRSVRHLNTRSLADCNDSKFKKWDPRQAAKALGQQISPRQAECWKLCNEFAVKLLKKQLPSVIGDRNMLANASIDDEDAWESWGKYCDLQVGTQMYGYQKRHDGYINYNIKKPANLNHGESTSKYVVQSGDTLGKIAEKYKTTVVKLMAKNQIKDPNKIRVGQIITI